MDTVINSQSGETEPKNSKPINDLEAGINKEVNIRVNIGKTFVKKVEKKCFSLIFLLKIMGLEPIFYFDPFPNFRNKKHFKIKKILNHFYTFLIFLLLSYQPVLETYLAFHNNISTFFPTTLFFYIIPIHYYIAIFYFRSQRKKRIYESRNMEFLDNEKGLAKCMPKEDTLIKSVSIISSVAIIEECITIFLITDPGIYSFMSNWFYNLSKILIFLSIVPGKLVLVINSHIFLFSFLQQLHKLQELEKKLKVKKWKQDNKSSVATLCYEIIDIRYTLTRLIKKTEFMYISTTIIGGVSIGLMIEKKRLELWKFYMCFNIFYNANCFFDGYSFHWKWKS